MKNSLGDAVGIGIGYPFSFSGGSLKLTATQRLFVSSDAGLGDNDAGQVQVLTATDDERKNVVRQSIRRILQVARGSEFMNGQSGSLVDLVPMEANDEGAQNLALMYGAVAVADQELRVRIKAAESVPNVVRPEIINCILSYEIDGTRILDNLVVLERGDNG